MADSAWSLYSGSSGGLKGLLDAFNEGVDLSRKREKETADSQREAEQWGFGKYKKPVLTRRGFAKGYESDAADREKDLKYFDLRKKAGSPGPAVSQSGLNYTAPITQNVMPPEPPVTPDADPSATTPSGRPIGATQQDLENGVQPSRDPQSTAGKAETTPNDPIPLIRDPDAAKQAAQQKADAIVQRPGLDQAPNTPGASKAKAQKLSDGSNAILAEGTQGVEYDPSKGKFNPATGRVEIPADKTTQSFDEGANVLGDVAPPAQGMPPAAAQSPQATDGEGLEPSDFALAQLVKQNTAVPRSGAGQLVDVNTLDPVTIKEAGITQDMLAAHVHMPMGVIQARIRANATTKSAEIRAYGQTVDPKYADLLDQVEQGNVHAGAAVRIAAGMNGGLPPPKAVLDAIHKAVQQGNANRNYGLSNDKFKQSVANQRTATLKAATNTAKSFVKDELDGWDASINVQNMLNQKNTAGLEAKINMMLTRAIAKARVTNMELQNMGGLTGVENQLNQWFDKVQGEGLTKENKALGLFIAQSLQSEYENAVKSRIGWVQNSAKRQLVMQGMGEDEADATLTEALDPSALIRFQSEGRVTNGAGPKQANVDEDGEPVPKAAPHPGKGATQVYPGVNVRNSNRPDPATDGGRAKLMAFKNQALRIIDADPNLSPEQKKAKSQAVQKKFEADMAAGRQKQGIK